MYGISLVETPPMEIVMLVLPISLVRLSGSDLVVRCGSVERFPCIYGVEAAISLLAAVCPRCIKCRLSRRWPTARW